MVNQQDSFLMQVSMMAEEGDEKPLNASDGTPDYDAIFDRDKKRAHFAKKTAIGQVIS